MMNKRFFVSIIVSLFLFSGVFAAQFEIFGAAPIAVSDEYDQTPQSLGAGLGIGFTSMDKGESFGVMMNGIVYHRLLNTRNVDSAPFPEEMSPVGLDFTFGAMVLPFDTKYLTIPITLAFHTRAALLDGVTQFDFGAAGTISFTFWSQRNGLFVRSLFYLDFSRVNVVHKNFNFEPKARLSSFGIIPQIGFTIRLGKTPEAKE
jgi:hypothetical protein